MLNQRYKVSDRVFTYNPDDVGKLSEEQKQRLVVMHLMIFLFLPLIFFGIYKAVCWIRTCRRNFLRIWLSIRGRAQAEYRQSVGITSGRRKALVIISLKLVLGAYNIAGFVANFLHKKLYS